MDKNCSLLIEISLKYLPKALKGSTNKPSFVQMMSWCCTGDKPLAEPIMAQFPRLCISLGFDELALCADIVYGRMYT